MESTEDKMCSPAVTVQRHQDKLKQCSPSMATMQTRNRDSPVKNRGGLVKQKGCRRSGWSKPARASDARMHLPDS
jgi:hypothetical protein